MAYVAGKPLRTSPEAQASFFALHSQLAMQTDLVDPLRCTKQVCGGSNRNGTLFVGHARAGGVAQLTAQMAELRSRPRSAMARSFQREIMERDAGHQVLPAFRFRCAAHVLAQPRPAPKHFAAKALVSHGRFAHRPEYARKPPMTPAARGKSLLPGWQADSVVPGRPGQRRARPASAPVRRAAAGADEPARTNRGRIVNLPEDFVPFAAFSGGWCAHPPPSTKHQARQF